LLFKVSTTE